MLVGSAVRRVAIVGGLRIPFARSMGAYAEASNQEMLTGSDRVGLKPDDYVFLRPNQSEAVFLQFGDIALFDGADIAASWPTFEVSA